MKKAIAKGTGLFIFGSTRSGTRLYEYLTHSVLGTQSGWIDKYRRTWPERLETFVKLSNSPLEGQRIMIHETGCVPVLACMNYLTCGNGGVLVNSHLGWDRLLQRYLAESINAALAIAPELAQLTPVPEERIDKLDSLRWSDSLDSFLNATETIIIENADPAKLELEDTCVDLVFSGGALEHYRPIQLAGWLSEAFRTMKAGGVIAPILDHRDHLHHFDATLPFLYHYQTSDSIYRLTHSSQLLYHNRLLPEQVASMFEEVGFKRIGIRRMTLPSSHFYEEGEDLTGDKGTDRRRLARRFREATDDDLLTAAAQYCFRKP